MRLPLKEYQKETLERLAEYCTAARGATTGASTVLSATPSSTSRAAATSPRPASRTCPMSAFVCRPAAARPCWPRTPLGTIGDKLLGTDNPACLWITPSTTIRDQTLRRLQKPTDPYREALQQSLDSAVEVVTLEEALTRPQSVQSDAASGDRHDDPVVPHPGRAAARNWPPRAASTATTATCRPLSTTFPPGRSGNCLATKTGWSSLSLGECAALRQPDRHHGRGAQRADAPFRSIRWPGSAPRSSWN